jgi:hypothetical protein
MLLRTCAVPWSWPRVGRQIIEFPSFLTWLLLLHYVVSGCSDPAIPSRRLRIRIRHRTCHRSPTSMRVWRGIVNTNVTER